MLQLHVDVGQVMFGHLYNEPLAYLISSEPTVEDLDDSGDYPNDSGNVVNQRGYIFRAHFEFGFTRVGFSVKRRFRNVEMLFSCVSCA